MMTVANFFAWLCVVFALIPPITLTLNHRLARDGFGMDDRGRYLLYSLSSSAGVVGSYCTFFSALAALAFFTAATVYRLIG